jgi:hypothetical protein
MFWIALSLIQIGHIAIFSLSAGLDLMQVKRLETLGLFEAQSMSSADRINKVRFIHPS